jgi:hypothetical protein
MIKHHVTAIYSFLQSSSIQFNSPYDRQEIDEYCNAKTVSLTRHIYVTINSNASVRADKYKESYQPQCKKTLVELNHYMKTSNNILRIQIYHSLINTHWYTNIHPKMYSYTIYWYWKCCTKIRVLSPTILMSTIKYFYNTCYVSHCKV